MKKGLFVGLLAAGVVGGGVLLARTVAADNLALGPKPLGFHRFGSGPMLEKKAETLGMSTDELKEALETKTWIEIMEEQGISQEEWRAQRLEKARGHWQEMGLSEEEIAEREEKVAQRRVKQCER